MQAEKTQSIIAAEMSALDDLIRHSLHSDVLLIRSIAGHIIDSGGKRLRPALVLLSSKATGYEGLSHLNLAAVVEFIHTATLLHDDVVDESELRRGRQTANAQYGNAASVLVGDFLYSRAFQMMLSAGSSRVMEILADATNTIAEGEVLQLLNTHNVEVTEDEYLAVIHRKTAKLFEAAARLGAILSRSTSEIEEGLAEYGMHLGTAFQLVDDVLDYSGDAARMGKNMGDDLNEGKPTLPLIYVLQNGTPEEAEVVRRAIEKGGRDGFPRVLAAIEATGALAYANGIAELEGQLARNAIAKLPESVYKNALLDLTYFAVSRIY